MIIVIGTALARPETSATVLGLSLAHCTRSRDEDGCIDHTVSADQETSDLFRFVEYWRDEEALKAHFAVPGSRKFVAAIAPLLARPPEIAIYRSEEVNLG